MHSVLCFDISDVLCVWTKFWHPREVGDGYLHVTVVEQKRKDDCVHKVKIDYPKMREILAAKQRFVKCSARDEVGAVVLSSNWRTHAAS